MGGKSPSVASRRARIFVILRDDLLKCLPNPLAAGQSVDCDEKNKRPRFGSLLHKISKANAFAFLHRGEKWPPRSFSLKMKPRFVSLLLILCLFLPGAGGEFTASAQIDSLIYMTDATLNAEQKGDLRLNFDNLLFVRDNEYQGHLAKGYTLPGFWLDPTLSFQPLRNLRLEVGVHMLHYWGTNKYPCFNYSDLVSWEGDSYQKGFHCVPVLRAHFQPLKGLDIIIGTIYGRANHGLAEPLYSEEMNLSSDPEAGVQAIWENRFLRLDSWINWETFIFDDDDHQESFTFGLSSRFFLNPCHGGGTTEANFDKPKPTKWYVPFQFLFQHHGGEVNTEATDRSVKTWLNAAAGIGVDLPLRTRLPVKLNLEATGTFYRQQSGSLLPFDQGFGLYVKATAAVSDFSLSLGYWQSHKFISIFGNPHFGTLSLKEDGLTYRNPSMLTAHVEYAKELAKGFAWGFHGDLYGVLPAETYSETNGWNRSGAKVSFSAGVYLRVNPSFLLKKF